MIYLLNGKFDMFKSASAFWEWLTSASAKTYVIIICVLIALLIAAVIFAVFKKARVQKNDVNVLMLLGDEDRSVDAEIFKRNYAMVLVSKNENTRTAKDMQVEQPELLAGGDDDEFAAAEDEIASDVTTANVDEFIVEDTVTDEVAEDVSEEASETVEEEAALEETEETEPVTDTLAVAESEEEIPFNEQADEAVEVEIEELEEEEIEEEPEAEEEEELIAEDAAEAQDEEIAEEEIEELEAEDVDDSADTEVVEVEEIAEEPTSVEADDSAEAENEPAEGQNEEVLFAPVTVIAAAEKQTVEEECAETDPREDINTVYDIDASEDYARDRIEVVSYLRMPGKVKAETELIENEEDKLEEAEIQEIAEESVEVSEELFLIESETEEEALEEPAAEPEKELAVEVIEEAAPEIIEEAAEETAAEAESEAACDAVDETQESVVFVSEAEAEGETEEDKEAAAAYTIVKEEEAVPEAIEAVQNGEVIVDANGDGVVAEVLVDKNILKARYKTVDLETRLRRADESTKVFYSELKNFLLSYEGVKSRVSKKFDTFTIGRFIVAKMAVRGNVINLYLALASETIDDKYFAEDVGDSDTYGKTPTLHKVKSKRGCKYGIELIRDIMSELQIQADESYQPTDFAAAYPPENIDEKKDAIRHLFKESVSIEDAGILSDEEALELIEIVKNKQYTINKFMPINKYVVFVDDLDALYNTGETVTINDLIEKEALPNEENIFLEIRAKGTINKPLTVEAHSFDPAAVKMIILTDGKVIQYK